MPSPENIPQHAGHEAHTLITGLPGVGKTTLIRGLARRLAAYNPAGFYTEEIRNAEGKREGFQIVTLCGRRQVLSHIDLPDAAESAVMESMSRDLTGFSRSST